MRGKAIWDRLLLRLPFKIGDVIQKVALARWSRTFSGSVAAGVPMLQSIKLTGDTAGNVVLEQAMDDVYASVKRGGSLAGPIEQTPIFPPMVGHMVAVGEETGQLEHMLSKIADFYEAEVDAKVKALTALIEPMMIVFVGGVVGFIVIAMYLPIFSPLRQDPLNCAAAGRIGAMIAGVVDRLSGISPGVCSGTRVLGR